MLSYHTDIRGEKETEVGEAVVSYLGLRVQRVVMRLDELLYWVVMS